MLGHAALSSVPLGASYFRSPAGGTIYNDTITLTISPAVTVTSTMSMVEAMTASVTPAVSHTSTMVMLETASLNLNLLFYCDGALVGTHWSDISPGSTVWTVIPPTTTSWTTE